MQINRETGNQNAIQSYSDTSITINHESYTKSIIVSSDKIIPYWPVEDIEHLTNLLMQPILELEPEIILIGHEGRAGFLPIPLVQSLTKQRISIEAMSIGAACRTFNVLICESRAVVCGLMIKY
jgi:uncharacterized protein